MRVGPSQSAVDAVVAFARVVASGIARDVDTGRNIGVTFNVAGIGGIVNGTTGPEIELGDDDGESREAADVFSALGLIGRPLPPSTRSGRVAHADVVCLRLADGLLPIGVRDNRLSMGGDGPAEGTVALVGYGGAFHAIGVVDGDEAKGARHTIYCPYDFDAEGIPQKAHVITLDPTAGNEAVTIVHAEGMAITMLAGDGNAIMLKNKSGNATLRLDDGGITATAGTINLIGNVVVGNTVGAVPLLAGTASPPCPRLFVSPA